MSRARAQERVNQRKEKLLAKYPTEFPPGFTFGWRHRHDPFEGYYRLMFGRHEWEIKDRGDVELTAREYAWNMYDMAVEICKEAKLIKDCSELNWRNRK